MPILHVIILAIVQGLTELLPVSSSAHVIVVAELFRENMSTPANALLLILLHTGTMFAVIVYFWRQWARTFFSSAEAFWRCAQLVFVACLLSGVVGYPVILLVEHILGHGNHQAAIEILFHKLNWITPALAAGGVLILYAGLRGARSPASARSNGRGIGWRESVWMGILQGLAIPFRGFSRSGSTISGGLLSGGRRAEIESFSFAMGVAITPLAIGWEVRRVYQTAHLNGLPVHWGPVLMPGFIGALGSFLAGLVALKWLSGWLDRGRWHWFGIYCVAAAVVVQLLYLRGW